MRESAVFYESFYKASTDFELTTEQKGELFEALCRYAFYGEEIDVSPTIKGIMTLVKPQIDNTVTRKSSSYRIWRKEVLERDKYTCQRCGGKDASPHVHHIKPYAAFPSLRDDIDNGITLCPECHREIHRRGK